MTNKEKSFKEISATIQKQLDILEAAKEAIVKIRQELETELGFEDSDPDDTFKETQQAIDRAIGVTEATMDGCEDMGIKE